jgi:hypothetical protein
MRRSLVRALIISIFLTAPAGADPLWDSVTGGPWKLVEFRDLLEGTSSRDDAGLAYRNAGPFLRLTFFEDSSGIRRVIYDQFHLRQGGIEPPRPAVEGDGPLRFEVPVLAWSWDLRNPAYGAGSDPRDRVRLLASRWRQDCRTAGAPEKLSCTLTPLYDASDGVIRAKETEASRKIRWFSDKMPVYEFVYARVSGSDGG